MKNQEVVENAKNVMESFLVLLSLSNDSRLKILFSQIADVTFYTLAAVSEPYIMRVAVHSSGIVTVILDKERFKDGICFHYKLRNYDITTSYGNDWDSRSYWHISSNKPKMINDVISVINKRIK